MKTTAAIAKELGVSRQSIWIAARALGIKPPREIIREAKAEGGRPLFKNRFSDLQVAAIRGFLRPSPPANQP